MKYIAILCLLMLLGLQAQLYIISGQLSEIRSSATLARLDSLHQWNSQLQALARK